MNEPEKGENPWFTALRVIAARGIMAQEEHEGDIQLDDGTLWCGKCGEPRRKYQYLENGNHVTPLLVSCKCACERNKEIQAQKDQEEKEKSELISQLYNDSLMDARLIGCTFDKFNITEENEKNRRICLKYAKEFSEMEKRNQGLLMYGSPGTGKTFAAACIANELLSNGVSVVMTSFVKILSIIDSDKKAEEELLEKLNQARLLVVDDLGAERSTEYALEKVYNIIDARCGRPMILTTNLTPKELSDTSDMKLYRIYDRVWQVCYPMKFQGQSWRMQEAGERYKQMEKFFDGC